MKTVSVIIFYCMISICSFAEIKNGFEKDLKKAHQAIANLKILMDEAKDDDTTLARLNTSYNSIKIRLDDLMKNFMATEDLIHALLVIHPSLYNEINRIKDYSGNNTDVYIRVLPEDQMKVSHFGTTNLTHAEDDVHTYQSIYGPGSVSVIVRQAAKYQLLRLLVHELGHVKYQVPNLASYMNYFNAKYEYTKQDDAFGHKPDDPSNKSVNDELGRFMMVYGERKHLLKKIKRQKDILDNSVQLATKEDPNDPQ